MSWLFAVLIVLAMGGVAAVAAGRGRSMDPAYDDRPDADVPAHGPLSADDLRRVRFPLALRGYRMGEVDALLDRLARERDDAAWQQAASTLPTPSAEQHDVDADLELDGALGDAGWEPRAKTDDDAAADHEHRGPGI